MRRAFVLISVIALLLMPASAEESFTLSAFIDGVSGGVDGIGFSLFPIGTTFGYEHKFPLIPGLRPAEMEMKISMAFNDSTISSEYDWETGRPKWAISQEEENGYEFLSGTYFNPRAYIDIHLNQGLWENPLDDKSALVDFRIGFNTRFSAALEQLNLSRPDGTSDPLFVDWEGNPKHPFDGSVPAFPWLQGSRNIWTNYLYLEVEWNHDRDTPTDAEAEHGMGALLRFEYGPWWLLNSVTDAGVQSDYWLLALYGDQKLEIFTVKKDDGSNWANMYLGHSNTFAYIGGDTVPYEKVSDNNRNEDGRLVVDRLSVDRLRGMFSDRIWLHFTGPQFFGDCYPVIELNLYNTLRFGSVMNEVDNQTHAVELQSSLTLLVQLKLFGFIRLEYQVGYDFIRGIRPDRPRWWQNAALSFYVSL